MKSEQNLASALVSILRKIEIMTENVIVSNEQNYLVLSSIDAVMKTNQSELKKQTSLLTSINNAVKGRTKSAFKKDDTGSESKVDFNSLKELAPSFMILAKASFLISKNSGKNILSFLNSVSTGLKQFNDIDENKVKSISMILGSITDFAKNILIFGGSLALYNILAIPAMLGAKLFGVTVNILLGTLKGITTEQQSSLNVINSIGLSILVFGGSLALYNILAIPAMLGALTFGLTTKILLATMKLDTKKSEKEINNLLNVGKGILLFGGTLALVAIAAVPILLGALVTTIAITGISLALTLMGNKKVLSGTKSLIWSSIGILTLGLSLAAFNAIVNPLQSLTSLLIIGGTALVFAFAGLMNSSIMKGSIAMTLATIPILLLSGAMYVWSKVNVKLEDVGVLMALVGGVGLTMALAGLAFPYIAAGAIAMGLSGLALLLMTSALEKFQTLNWSSANSDNLSYTIKSVLGALSGTSSEKSLSQNIKGVVGQGLQAISSVFAIGPLLLGSAAIWLMSDSLVKFQSVKWKETDSLALNSVITTILGSLSQNSKTSPVQIGNSMLANISALMGAGSIFVASGAIWLMSEALIKFQSVKWQPGDTVKLNDTISMILKSFANSEKSGGLWSKIKSTAKSWLGASASAGNATSIGLAGLSIGSLASGLQKWKALGWNPNDTKLLTSSISSILFATSIKGNDNLFALANNFNRIQNSMKLFKDHVNAMDIKKLTLTDSMMHSIALLSKSPDAIGKTIQDTIEKSFEKMTKAFIDSIKGVKTESVNQGITKIEGPVNKITQQKTNNSQIQTKNQQPLFTLDDMQDAFTAALMSVTLKVKQVESSF